MHRGDRNRMIVRPAPGRRVRMFHDPRKVLPPEGAAVPRSAEWIRAVRAGDVEIVTEAPPEPAEGKAPAKAHKRRSKRAEG